MFTREEEEVYIEEKVKVETNVQWKKRLCRLESLKAEPNVKCR